MTIASLCFQLPRPRENPMPPLLRYLINRSLSVPITLFVITAVLYATVMLTPAETRATLYLPRNLPSRMTEAQYQKLIDQIIIRYHLDAPYPVQYFYWVTNLVQGNWGYSPTLREDVLTAIIKRTPATAELTLYSILAFIPLGLVSGVIAGSKQNKLADHRFRLTAFIATSLPPFILALFLLAIFYIGLYWFAPERTSLAVGLFVNSDEFRLYTGLLTIDGLLNGRFDISLDALRHLVMPVFTLAIAHWATLGRVTRATIIEELQKDYVVAAKARGIPERSIVWRHMLRNAIAPALTSSLLSAASLLTGVFVVEIIFNFHGISEIAVSSMQFTPDAPAALGFAIYSVVVVLILMFILDLIQSSLDPRIREGVL
jgi:peptide/nickel transport system permease protein